MLRETCETLGCNYMVLDVLGFSCKFASIDKRDDTEVSANSNYSNSTNPSFEELFKGMVQY